MVSPAGPYLWGILGKNSIEGEYLRDGHGGRSPVPWTRVRAGGGVVERQLLLPAVHFQERLRLRRVAGLQGWTDTHHDFHLHHSERQRRLIIVLLIIVLLTSSMLMGTEVCTVTASSTFPVALQCQWLAGRSLLKIVKGKWWTLMCVKPLAVKDYPASVVVFLDYEPLASMGLREHMAPLLSNPLALPPPSPPCSLPIAIWKMPASDDKAQSPPRCILRLNIQHVWHLRQVTVPFL